MQYKSTNICYLFYKIPYLFSFIVNYKAFYCLQTHFILTTTIPVVSKLILP